MKDGALLHPLFLHIFQTKNLYSMALIQPRTDRNTIFRVTKMLSWEHGFPSGIQLKAVSTIARYFKKGMIFLYKLKCGNMDLCDRIKIFTLPHARNVRYHQKVSKYFLSPRFFFSRGKSFFISINHFTVPKALGVPTPVFPRQKVSWNYFKMPTVTQQG